MAYQTVAFPMTINDLPGHLAYLSYGQGPRKVTKSGGQREGVYGERGSASL